MKKLTDMLQGLPHFHGGMPGHSVSEADRLTDLVAFGSNPGNLRARLYAPAELPARPALVVVLHGCTQTAAGYDRGAGWSHLAEQEGFVLLFPEQRRENNPNLCFNWFLPEDTRRDAGEALSIRQMIDQVVRERGIDPARIFITGLSAGGAMTSVMLACYPELFAGGAIIAGLPYGCASGVPQALARMRGQALPDAAGLDRLLRGASRHAGKWPTISVWHGSADQTVIPSNAEAIISQWQAVHRVGAAADVHEIVDGYPRRAWRDAEGHEVIEAYSITGMGHGTPLSTQGTDPCGVIAPHMLEAGISSTRRIAGFWKLTDTTVPRTMTPARQATTATSVEPSPTGASATPQPPSRTTPAGVGKVIEDALRAAGLLR